MADGIWLTRAWGLVLVAVGLWFFASVTLGYDLPTLNWNLVWPLGLIALGVVVIGSALGRRH